MKKNKTSVLLLIIVFAVMSLLAGCGGGAGENTNGNAGSISNLKFLSGPTGTTWYSQASAFAGIASKDMGVNVDVLSGSAVGNVIQVENGKADLALTFSSYLPAIAEGKIVAEIGNEKYFSEPTKNVRILCNATTAAYVLLVSADSPYKNISDLKGKPIKYVTYPVGFTARYVPEKILEAHGVTTQSIEDAKGKVDIVGKYEEACDLLAKGQADVIAYTMAVNAQSAALAELEAQKKFRILKLDEQVAEQITNEIPVTIETLPKGLHNSILEDTQVIADVTVWLVRAGIPDETVEQILTTVLNNMDTMGQVGNSEFNGFTAKELNRLYGIGSQPPLHPGAEKFYRENGAL